MTTPRTTLADQIKADYEESKGYKVYPYPYFPSEVRKPVISVWRTDLNPNGDSPNYLIHPLEVQIYGGKTVGEAVEAELDTVLDDVMLSLQRVEGLTFDGATRTVFGTEDTGQFQGWSIKCHGDSKNVYKSQILTEG